MATSSTFFLNGPSLGSATAVFLNDNLSTCAPDGFYSDGVIVREQVGCVLLPQQTCPSCAVPCGSTINASGNQGVYLVNLDTGNSIGAVIVRFDPYSFPDGIKATFNGVVYNKLTSPIDGLHQSSNTSNLTFIGNTNDDCGISGTTYPALQEFLYNGTAFAATGLTQSISVAPGDVSLSTQDPGSCMMVIPKTSASPSIINFAMVGPCLGTAFAITISCPVLLTGFSSSSVFGSSALACAAGETQTYYNASLDNTPGIVDVFDFVYSDNLGSIPLANGFYNATGSIAGGANWFQVVSGVVVAVGNCGSEITLCFGTSEFDVCCECDITPTNCAIYELVNGTQSDGTYSFTTCAGVSTPNQLIGGFEELYICAVINSVSVSSGSIIVTEGSPCV